MTTYKLNPTTEHKNNGIKAEHIFYNYMTGDVRTKHDNGKFDRDSDVNVGDRHYSVKASHFTLISGSACKGCETFDEIWNFYATHTHSNLFAYITLDYIAYVMTIDEFKTFTYTFCTTEKESQKNGGYLKIRCKKETQKMREWLAQRA